MSNSSDKIARTLDKIENVGVLLLIMPFMSFVYLALKLANVCIFEKAKKRNSSEHFAELNATFALVFIQ